MLICLYYYRIRMMFPGWIENSTISSCFDKDITGPIGVVVMQNNETLEIWNPRTGIEGIEGDPNELGSSEISGIKESWDRTA